MINTLLKYVSILHSIYENNYRCLLLLLLLKRLPALLLARVNLFVEVGATRKSRGDAFFF